MPFEIVRNDITKVAADAIVNTANPKPMVGAGTDAMIHKAAGPRLLQARMEVGPMEPGQAAITPAFRLRAKYVIHTVGPVWVDGSHNEAQLLQACYEESLRLAREHGCQSIAFPLISTGTYGFPKDKALQIAVAAISGFLLDYEMQIYLVVFDKKSFQLSEKLFQNIASYIDENYASECRIGYSREESSCQERRMLAQRAPKAMMPAPMVAASISLEDVLGKADAGFTETLLKRIDETGKKDSEIYKKANVSKQHFSKIRNNPHYQPTKATAIAFALALELDLAQTNDLIGRAGYTLTNSSKFDLIIQYFIQQKNYNIVEINVALYEFDQNLLGA